MYSRILVPLDGSPLAERALHHAMEIAGREGAEIVVVRAVDVPLAVIPETGFADEMAAVDEIFAEARSYVDGVVASASKDGYRMRGEVAKGIPEDIILGAADRENVDVIVMSTHGRTGLSRWLMGSVAEAVMTSTRRPLLLVKPQREAAHKGAEGRDAATPYLF
jgi:nucleotide-binding universal stress UspA family protein